MTEKNESNRRRKWAPKARTGCKTCKTRHVKCDEARPSCRRCILSGFRCEGYLETPSTDDVDVVHLPGAKTEHTEQSVKPNAPHMPNSWQSQKALIVIKPHSSPPSIIRPYTPTPLTVISTDPYVSVEKYYLDFFVKQTAAMVSRSSAAPYFWHTLVPQAAWAYPSVRHAMLAAAMSSESLVRRDSISATGKRNQLRVLSHASQAVQALLHNDVPLDVILLTSATLGILELFRGSWSTACTHVISGAKLAKQTKADKMHEPHIKFYCEAFASALPTVLSSNQTQDVRPPQQDNSVTRLFEAVESLRLGLQDLTEAADKAEHHDGSGKTQILSILKNARVETKWILQRWEILLREELHHASPRDADFKHHLLQVASPWSNVIASLDSYLDQGDDFEVRKFEVVMGRTLPFYMLAKSGPHIRMREDAVELMYTSSKLRGLTNTTSLPHPGNHLVKDEG